MGAELRQGNWAGELKMKDWVCGFLFKREKKKRENPRKWQNGILGYMSMHGIEVGVGKPVYKENW